MDLAQREQRVFALLQEFKRRPNYLQWLLVNNGRRLLLLLKVDDISWIEAQGNYVRVHHDRGSHLIRETIGALESQLNPDRFLRIHRSVIVHLGRIKGTTPMATWRISRVSRERHATHVDANSPSQFAEGDRQGSLSRETAFLKLGLAHEEETLHLGTFAGTVFFSRKGTEMQRVSSALSDRAQPSWRGPRETSGVRGCNTQAAAPCAHNAQLVC